MNTKDPIVQQYLLSTLAVVVGFAGWFAPHKWNPLRLRGRYARHISSTRVTNAIPKVVGTLLIVAGALMAIATSQIGSFQG